MVYGPYWRHVKEAWEKREAPNLHFVFYEDLKADPASELKRLGGFLGCDLAKDQLENVRRLSHCMSEINDGAMNHSVKY